MEIYNYLNVFPFIQFTTEWRQFDDEYLHEK